MVLSKRADVVGNSNKMVGDSIANPLKWDSERNGSRAHHTPLLSGMETRQWGLDTAWQTTNFSFTQTRRRPHSSLPFCHVGWENLSTEFKHGEAANAIKWLWGRLIPLQILPVWETREMVSDIIGGHSWPRTRNGSGTCLIQILLICRWSGRVLEAICLTADGESQALAERLKWMGIIRLCQFLCHKYFVKSSFCRLLLIRDLQAKWQPVALHAFTSDFNWKPIGTDKLAVSVFSPNILTVLLLYCYLCPLVGRLYLTQFHFFSTKIRICTP